MRILNVLLTINFLIYTGWFVAVFGTMAYATAGLLSVAVVVVLFTAYLWWGLRYRIWTPPSRYVRRFIDSFEYKFFALIWITAINGFIVFLISPSLRQFVARALRVFGVEFDPG